jgi:MoxR-like ATPase
MTMAATLVPCPLGNKCLTGTTVGHDPKSDELAKCRARAEGKTSAGMAGDYDPSRAYKSETSEMRRLTTKVKRAWGADGRGIPNLIGPPGIGKSEYIRDLARSIGADFMIFDVSSLDPDILNGIPYNPESESLGEGDEDSDGRIRIAGRLYERDIADMFFRDPDKPLVLFFDEINGGKESLMSSLQKVMTGRTLPQEGVPLNDNVFMVAAMNDAEHTSNGNDLAAAMVSRLTPIPMRPNYDEWVNGELTFWGKGYDADRMERVAAALGDKAPNPEQYLEAVTHVSHYLESMGNPRITSGKRDESTLNLFAEPLDEDDLTRKVGQPRSWTKAVSGIAAAIANPDEEISDTEAFADVIRANCGERAARDFTAYHETHKDLPDVNEALDKGTLGDARKEWKKNGRADIPLFTMGVIANAKFDDDFEKMGRALDILGEIADDYPDMAASRMPGIVSSWKDSTEAALGQEGKTKLASVVVEKIKSHQGLKEAFGRRSASAVLEDGHGAVTAGATAAKGYQNSGKEN